MAETNAKREARRRRILENSENRLRRITTRYNPDETKDNNPLVENSVVTKQNEKTKSNTKEYSIRNGIYNVDNQEQLQDNIKLNDNEHENFLNNTSDKNTCSSKQVSNIEFMLCTLLTNRINFILLAGIVNILFVWELDGLFGQAIIIPYLLLMLGRLYSCKKLHEAQNGSLLVAALLLCNIKPDLVYKFKVLFTLFNIVIIDFGLYMFSFVLMRYIITCYIFSS